MKRKKRKKNIGKMILILTVAVLVLICIFGFRTRKIQVSGNVYYGEGTITNWIEKDPLSVNSLYLLGKYTFDKGELPSGVESLKVSLKNPWTVAVTVVEKSMLGYVDYDEAMLYFDEQGIATLRSAKQIEGVPYIEGLSFDTAEVEIGKVLPVEDDAIFEKLAETSRYLRKNALSPERIVCNTDGRDALSHYRIDRMEQVEMNFERGRDFYSVESVDEFFEISKYLEEHPRMSYEEPVRATLLVDETLVEAVELEFRITAKMKAQDNVFRMRIVSTKTAICNWIINLTEYIRIETTSDPSIIELLCYRARCIIELYQKAQK